MDDPSYLTSFDEGFNTTVPTDLSITDDESRDGKCQILGGGGPCEVDNYRIGRNSSDCLASNKLTSKQNRCLDDHDWSLDEISLSENEYSTLRQKDPETLSMKEFFIMKLYRKIYPLQHKNECLKSELKKKSMELELSKEQLECVRHELLCEQEERLTIKSKCEAALEELRIIRCQLEDAEKKFRNLNILKEEKMHIEALNDDLKNQNQVLESQIVCLKKDYDLLKVELVTTKQENRLLSDDKDYLDKQVDEKEDLISHLNGRIFNLEEELTQLRKSNEEMLNTFISTRNNEKEEYETYLRDEINKFKLNTQTSLDKFKQNQKEVYEDSLKALTNDKEKLEQSNKMLEEQLASMSENYFSLKNEFESFKREKYSETTELEKNLRMKNYDLERMQAVKQQTTCTLEDMKQENNHLLKMVQELKEEVQELKASKFYNMESRCETFDSTKADNCTDQTVGFHSKMRKMKDMERTMECQQNVLAKLMSEKNDHQQPEDEGLINVMNSSINRLESSKAELEKRNHALLQAIETLMSNREAIEEMRNELMQQFNELKEDPQLASRINECPAVLNNKLNKWNGLDKRPDIPDISLGTGQMPCFNTDSSPIEATVSVNEKKKVDRPKSPRKPQSLVFKR